MNKRSRILIHVCFSALVWVPTVAHTSGATAANGHNGDHLKMVVILSRHGVRSPTWTADRLDVYSALPWPTWNVQPGYLTSSGFELVKLFGGYDRAALAQTGLIAADGCADAATAYIWADTDQRTMESGRALAEGMFPGCQLTVDGLKAGEADPLFHPAATGEKRSQLFAALPSDANTKPRSDPQQGELLAEMQHVLLGCPVKISCTPAHVPATRLLNEGSTAGQGSGKLSANAGDPLASASTFAEDFLLEYGDGMPNGKIGWGHVDEQQLRRFLQLHSDYFDIMYRKPASARAEASNMLFHIVRTLEQGVAQSSVADALGPANSKVVVLAGHDTNIAAVAALLGLHWTLDGRTDDTPPGMQLVFELWQNDRGAWSARINVQMQTLSQLRTLEKLTLATPPAHQDLTRQIAGKKAHTIAWQDFERIADAATGKNAVSPKQPN